MTVFFKPPFLKLEIEESRPDLSADAAGNGAFVRAGGAGGIGGPGGGGGGGGGGIPPFTGARSGAGDGDETLACDDEAADPFSFGFASVLFKLVV